MRVGEIKKIIRSTFEGMHSDPKKRMHDFYKYILRVNPGLMEDPDINDRIDMLIDMSIELKISDNLFE